MIVRGVESISLQDIQAYCYVYDDQLDRWQVDAILGLDSARREEWQTQSQD